MARIVLSRVSFEKSADCYSARDDVYKSGQRILRPGDSPIQSNTHLKDTIHELRRDNQEMDKQTEFSVQFVFVT